MSRERPIGLGEPIRFGASGIEKRLAAFGRHHPLEGRRLLDAGCGNGAYTLALAPGFEEVEAIDVESGRLEAFRRRLKGSPLAGRVRVRELSVEELDYPDGHFDVVTAIEVIEHVLDLERALGEIRRVLRPGGFFLLTCPNRLFPFETHCLFAGGRSLHGKYVPFVPWIPPLHRRLAKARTFTAGSLRDLLERSGFREEAHDYVMPPFDGLPLARRLVRPLTDRLERTPLRRFGVSLVGVYTRPAA